MARKGPLLLILLALVLAGVAAWGAQRWVQSRAAQAARQRVVLEPVVLAARDLPAGHAIKPGDLRVVRWPATSLPRGHFSSPAALKGRVPRTPLFRGEVVLAAKLAAKGLPGGLSSVVPSGFRAMTVKVDEVIGVGGFVQPGDRVDVLVTVERGPFRDDPVTRTVLQDVKVLTVGEKVALKKNTGGKPRRHKAQVVTLQLTPAQGEALALAATTGKVLLALRNQADNQQAASPGVRLTALVPAAAAEPVAQKHEEEAPAVEVIRGTRRSQQSLATGKNQPAGGSGKALVARMQEFSGVQPCATRP